MSKDDFNRSSHVLNEYNLKLRTHCGMTPLKAGDDDPMYQAGVFGDKVTRFLQAEDAYERGTVLSTETLAPSREGLPRMRIICTAEVMALVQEEFSRGIVATDLVRQDVGADRAQKNPGSIYPPGRNCWDPSKWKK